jgi:hypothetical protein
MEDQEACVILGLDNVDARKVGPDATAALLMLVLTLCLTVDVQKNVQHISQVVE